MVNMDELLGELLSMSQELGSLCNRAARAEKELEWCRADQRPARRQELRALTRTRDDKQTQLDKARARFLARFEGR